MSTTKKKNKQNKNKNKKTKQKNRLPQMSRVTYDYTSKKRRGVGSYESYIEYLTNFGDK